MNQENEVKKEEKVIKKDPAMKLAKYKQKMSVFHEGVCSSPYYKDHCPCPRDCPLHGRCCDCVHHHIDERVEAGVPAEDAGWIVECMKLAHEGKFDQIYVERNNKDWSPDVK